MNLKTWFSEKLFGQLKGNLGRVGSSIVSVRIIAIILLAIFIPSLLITALGLFAVYQAEPILRERLEYPIHQLLDRLDRKLVREWDQRLQRYAERLAVEPALNRYLLQVAGDDPYIRDVYLCDAGSFQKIEPEPPLWKLETPLDDPDLVKAWALEHKDKDLTGALREYRRIIRGGVPELMVEALAGQARVLALLGDWREAIRTLRRLTDRFGESVDASGVPRGLPAMHRIVELCAEHDDPVAERINALELNALLDRLEPWIDPETARFYRDQLGLHRIEGAVERREDPAARWEEKISALLSNREFHDRLLEHAALESRDRTGYFRIPVQESEDRVLAFFDVRSTGKVVYLDLDPGAYLSDVRLFTAELGIAGEQLRFDAGSRAKDLDRPEEPAAVMISRPFPSPFQHLALNYFPTPEQMPAHLQHMETLRKTGFTWAIIILVLFISLGILVTVRSVHKEVQVSRIKSDFVSFVTHELKTPLTAIRMFTETLLLGRAGDPAEERKCVELIDKEAARLSRLIQQILEFSKVEKRQQVFHFTSCDMADVVKEAVRIFRQHNPESDLELEINMAQHISRIRMDRPAMIELLLNLLSNAYKYSREGRKRIEITVRESIDDIAVDVVDHGIGIPRREQRKIFEKFYRAQDFLTRDIEGSGLGLTFARYIAKVHNGDIKVSSAMNQGSTFTLELRKTQVLAE